MDFLNPKFNINQSDGQSQGKSAPVTFAIYRSGYQLTILQFVSPTAPKTSSLTDAAPLMYQIEFNS